MSFFMHPVPTLIPVSLLMLGFLLEASPSQAGGFTAPGLISDSDDLGRDTSDLLSDRRKRSDPDEWRRQAILGSAVASDLSSGVAARELLEAIEDGVNDGRWIPFRNRKTRGQEILATLDQALPDQPAAAGPSAAAGQESLRSRFRFHVTRGLEFRQDIEGAGEEMRLQLYGPLVSGSPGLGLRVRGDVRERAFEFQAFGSTDEVGVQIHFDF
jgi:hypothetical protein